MKSSEYVCVECEDVITNPICIGCFKLGIEKWLEDREPRLVPFFRDRVNVFSSIVHKGIKCIICHDKMNICLHCYGKEVYGWLNEIYPNKRAMVNEFLSIFDFNWHHRAKD